MSGSGQSSAPGPSTGSSARAAVHETEHSVVFLVGDRAYKLHKPAGDSATRAGREQSCRQEVELSRRLAPRTYLGVATVTDPAGQPCEHLVVMQRMPEEQRLTTLVRRGEPLATGIRLLARELAEFHAVAARGEAVTSQGSRDVMRAQWRATLDRARTSIGAETLVTIEKLIDEFLTSRAALFDRRIAEGRIVDGHGDLLADNIFRTGETFQVLGGPDLGVRARSLDGLNDVALLAADLEQLGAADLATLLVGAYTEYAGDPAPPALWHHFLAYRALSLAADPRRPARQLARMALDHLRAGAVRLILVCGGPASGKSTLSTALGLRLGATVLSTDRVRAQLAGSAAVPAVAVYPELLRQAGERLGLGETVILDASWSHPEHRLAARVVAARTHSRLVALQCWAPAATTVHRLAHRTGKASGRPLGGTAEMNPWPDTYRVLTAGTPDDALVQALAVIWEESQ
ncbi:AAA family ATPase [Saccharomonospora sp. NPDC046836]|uniref:AAA family ATPase n=1 Tax=Saccharomonospora sp. NPDC046836 TaxID=3156921 RepID=UPI00340B6929